MKFKFINYFSNKKNSFFVYILSPMCSIMHVIGGYNNINVSAEKRRL